MKLEKIFLTIDELSTAVTKVLSRGVQLMMEKMIFGRYVPADSIIHKMDPRSKLMIIFLFVCVIFLANNVVTYALIGIYTFLMLGIVKSPGALLCMGV